MTADINDLAVEVGNLLLDNDLKVATVESCTGGWIAQTITNISGSSAWFDRGFVTYSNEAKQELVGVNSDTLIAHGAVSRQVAMEMALGGVKHSQANIAVSVTGIAGPDGGTPEKPVGTVWIGWANQHKTSTAEHFQFKGDRYEVRLASVEQALKGLVRILSADE